MKSAIKHSSDYKKIQKSKYFNKKYYLKLNPDIEKNKIDPVEHYLTQGWTENRNPSIKFDGDAYLSANPDVKAANMNPLLHYENTGKKEGRKVYPVIEFTLGDKISYAALRFSHFLGLISHEKYKSKQRRFIYQWYSVIYKSKYFDIDYYTKHYPEVDKENAIEHYMERGFLLGYNPSAKFDTNCYLSQRPDVLVVNMNPLYHYEVAGKNENMKPMPVQTPATYPAEVPSNSVLLFSHELSLTGAPIALLNSAKALKSLGYFPIVFSPLHGDLEQDLQKNAIPYVVDSQIFLKLYKGDLKTNCFFNKFKLIIFNTIATLKYAKLLNTTSKKIMWVHEGSFGYGCTESDMNISEAFDKLDRVYSVGQYSKSFTDKYINQDKSDVLLYGIEELKEQLGTPQKSNKLSFGIFGLVSKRKGVDIFVNAVKKLPKSIKNKCEFKVVGLLPNDEWTSEVVNSAKGEPIVFTGQMPHDLMMQEMNNTDVVVCSSLDDPMPIVCTEAMQLSKPVICSDLTGTASFIKDGQNSFIWHANEDKLEDIFVKAYKNKENLEKMGKKWNQIYTDNFTKQTFTNSIKRIMRKHFEEKAVNNSYDLFIPIGVSCHCSMMLRMLGLQNESYPFDWSGHEKHNVDHDAIFKEKIKLLCNDFKNFVDKQDMVELIERQKPNAKHRYLINSRTGLHYVHDFPLDQTVDEYYAEFKDKYQRRAKRLLNNIKSSNRVALVWMQDTWDQMRPENVILTPEVVSEQLKLLEARFPDTEFDLLVFNNNDLLDGKSTRKFETDNVKIYTSNNSNLMEMFYSKKYNQFMIQPVYDILSKLNKNE